MTLSSEYELIFPTYWRPAEADTKCAELRDSFELFVTQSRNKVYLLIANLFVTISFIASLISSSYYASEPSSEMSVVVLGTFAWAMLFFASCAGWHFFFFSDSAHDQLFNCQPTLQTSRFVFIVGTTLGISCRLFARVQAGKCESTSLDFIDSWNCNPCFLDNGFPTDSTLSLIAIPFIFTMLVKETRLDFLLASWIIIVLTFLISSILIGSHFHTLELIPFLVLGLLTIVDFSKTFVLIFLLQHNQEQQFKDDSSANNMRSMLANLAHDLKTPLSSFMTGVDALNMTLQECTSSIHQGEVNLKKLVLGVDTMQECLHNIRDTNSFMLMTINRCIDYAKASTGLKLVPKYETIELYETLMLPLNCMKNIQDKVSISLHQIPADICSHLITDKQWLQENVLCLLSNAVKYSSGGEVSISVSRLEGRVVSSTKTDEVRTSTPVQPKKGSNGVFTIDLRSKVHPDFDVPSSKDTNRSSPSANSNLLLIEIEDQGIGISDEAQETLFNPFKQTQRLAGGTGLGLFSLAKRIEALHGLCGIRQRSDGQQGSVFWFAIPYRPDYTIAETSRYHIPALERSMAESERTSEVSKSWHGLRVNIPVPIPLEVERYIDNTSPRNATTPSALCILLAEDSPTISRMTAMILSRHGHVVEVVENGALALSAVQRRLQITAQSNKPAFDVVLMDLQMPVMDGLEAAKRIRMMEASFEATTKPPAQLIFALSADWDEEVTQAATVAGIDLLMQKPFNVNDFYRFIHQYKHAV